MVLWPEVGGVDGWRRREKKVLFLFLIVLTNLPLILTENITGVPLGLTE